MSAERLRAIFAPFATNEDATDDVCGRERTVGDAGPYIRAAGIRPKASLSKGDFYRDGLSGAAGAAALRDALALSLDLPRKMSANALLAAINLLCTEEEYEAALTRARTDIENQRHTEN
jgi:hypothetical protein